MKKVMPLVSFIIVHYNGKQLIRECLDSLAALHYPAEKREVIVVDNGSSDDSVKYIKRDYPSVKVLKNDVNNYARANNRGIRAARGEFIALANNDLVFDKAWLRELIKVMGTDKRIGAVTGKVLFPDGKLQGTGHYAFPNFYWSDRGFREQDVGQYDKIEELRSISHCAILYRSACLGDVGPLDEDFNMYVEDVDMAIRAGKKGWRLLYVPRARVYHKFHGTVKEQDVDYYCERNRLFLIAKHFPEKLPSALFGRGYFTLMNHRDDLMKVLPEVLDQWVRNHGAEFLKPLWPALFDNLKMITYSERDFLAKQLDRFKNDVSERDQKLVENKRIVSEQGCRLTEQGLRLDALAGQLQRSHEERAQQNTRLGERDQRIEELVKQCADKDGVLEEKEKRIISLKEQLEEQSRQAGEKYRFLSEREGQVARLGEQLAQKDAQLREKEQRIAGLEQQGAVQEAHLVEQEKRAALLMEQAAEKEESLARLGEQLAQKDAQLREKEQRIADLEQQGAVQEAHLGEKEKQAAFLSE
ncbi:MAG: glycosyltransferase, partial [Candidatus Omnitrophica bacterium]|nr:glycosyltransferase [Candidatus Omnitrophota bacterium]